MGHLIQKRLLLYFALLLLGISGFFFPVIFPTVQGFYAFIVIAALGGFGVSANIFYAKRNKEQLVCPTGSDCNAVVTSKYSKFFGIPLEYLGMGYFLTVALVYGSLIFDPTIIVGSGRLFLIMLSTAAFFFSSYLLFVQAFLLRQWCIWCILASMFSYTIFFMSLSNLAPAVLFLGSIEPILRMLQFLGFAFGMGGSTAAVFLFFKFLKNLNIDTKESDTLKGISELVWLGVALVLLSQFSLYITHPATLAQSSTFLAQIIALFLVIVSGAILMLIFAPYLAYLPYSKATETEYHTSFPLVRRLTFIIGAIAQSSWYFAFATNYVPKTYTLPSLLIFFGATLLAGVAASIVWEHILIRRKPEPKEESPLH